MYLLIVTGLSGAGKTQALKRLEDLGFFCVDNLPGELLLGFAQICQRTHPPIERAAVVIDSRGSMFLKDVDSVFSALKNADIQQELLYLECQDAVLERRYIETRRKHPLSMDIRKGIEMERELLAELRDRANYVIDTTNLKALGCMQEVEKLIQEQANPFHLVIKSFGYKRGIPAEADFVFDMRFLENPYYEPSLRTLSGTDEPVRRFIERDPAFMQLIDSVEELLDMLMPKFHLQGKYTLTVAFGCTGGRHRSVCAAETLYARMQNKCPVQLEHRDTNHEREDIGSR